MKNDSLLLLRYANVESLILLPTLKAKHSEIQNVFAVHLKMDKTCTHAFIHIKSHACMYATNSHVFLLKLSDNAIITL